MTTAAIPTVAALEPDVVDVDPGAEASCALALRNDGDVVESYEIEVLGDAAAWTVLEPPTVSVYPGETIRVAVRFRPTRDGRVPAGEVPFGVRVTPSLYPDTAVMPEGMVRVSPYTATTAEIRPRTSAARRTGRHLVAVDNRGNVGLALAVSGTDPDDAVKVTGRPATLTVGPGQAAFAKVRVRHRRRVWRGQPVTRPFQVLLTPPEYEAAHSSETVDAPVVLDGTALQLPVIPRGAGKLLAAVVALALLGAGLWFGVLRPAVTAAAEEAAEDAVQEPLSEVSAQADQAAEAAEQAQSAAEALVPPATPTPDAGTGTAAGDGAGTRRHRFETVVATGATLTSDPLTAPEDASLAITDLVLQNPQGDTGRLDILVGGVPVHTEALQNIRNVDYHFVTAIEVPAGEALAVRTSCVTPGPALAQTSGSACRVFVLAVGYAQPVAEPGEV
jgi:hypothetical protein